MNSGSGECLRAWSTPIIKETIEYQVGDRPKSTDPAQDAVWQGRATELFSWANTRPDVTSRVLACTFFSDTPVVPPLPPSSGSSPATAPALPTTLRNMCRHALEVNERYRSSDRREAAAAPGKPREIPQEEVTFMATLVEPCLRVPGSAALPNVDSALEGLLGGSWGRRDGADEAGSGVRRLLLDPVLDMLARTDGWAGGPPGNNSVHDAARAPLSATLPFGSGTRDSDMFLPPSADALGLWYGGGSSEGSAMPPFAVQPREEVARLAKEEGTRLRSTTVVRGGESTTIARPKWAAEIEAQNKKYDEIADWESEQKEREREQSLKDSASGKTGEESGVAVAEGDAAAPTGGDSGLARTLKPTVMQEGELVFMNGRFVVVEPKSKNDDKKKEKDEKKSSHEKKDVNKTTKRKKRNKGNSDEEEEVADSTSSSSFSSESDSGDDEDAVSATKRRTRKRRRSRDPEPSSPMTSSRRVPARVAKDGPGKKKKKSNAQQQQKPLSAAVVSIQGVPLKSREDLVELVKSLDIPEALSEALLIGLEPQPSASVPDAESPSGPHRPILRLVHGTTARVTEEADSPPEAEATELTSADPLSEESWSLRDQSEE